MSIVVFLLIQQPPRTARRCGHDTVDVARNKVWVTQLVSAAVIKHCAFA